MKFYLRLPSFELIEQSFCFGSNVQLGVVVDEEDNVGMIDEPLASVVERITAIHLSNRAGFQDAGNFSKRGLGEKENI